MRFALAWVPAVLGLATALPTSESDTGVTKRGWGGQGGQGGRGWGYGPGKPNAGSHARSCNTATNRACWRSGFSVETDYETSVPVTGVTRRYTLVVSEAVNWTGPDGVVKDLVQLINGSLPGPTLVADWGDSLEVTVVNALPVNGTSMHWHGVRQLHTNLQDGVNGVTECPIAPGQARTYRFLAQQYGSSWYHSHFSAQYGNGVVGTIQINGPAAANYDVDLGVFPVSDYYYRTADELVAYTANNAPPASDNVLFNGTNVHPVTGAGRYARVALTPNKTHRLRIINTSVENGFVLSLGSHRMTIIAADFVPVRPLVVDHLFVAVGQRYDVVIRADQDVASYWFNATFPTSGGCGASHNPYPAAVFAYTGSTDTLPSDPGSVASVASVASVTDCADVQGLVPVVARSVPLATFASSAQQLPITLDLTQTGQRFTWRVNGTKTMANWEVPVDQYAINNSVRAIPADNNVVVVDRKDQWVFWVIENDPAVALPHPIHLHGHDVILVGQSNTSSTFADTDLATLSGANPVRRDVVMLPATGWIAIAYKADNPGTWLMHCHIAWHVSGGLAINFLERPNDLRTGLTAADKAQFNRQCDAWNTFYPHGDDYHQADSGLKRRVQTLRPRTTI